MKRFALFLALLIATSSFGQYSFYVQFPDTYVISWDGVHYGVSINDTLTWADDSTFDSTTHYTHIPYTDGTPDSLIDTTIVIDTTVVTHTDQIVATEYHTRLVDTVHVTSGDTIWSEPFIIKESGMTGHSATLRDALIQCVVMSGDTDSTCFRAEPHYSGQPGCLDVSGYDSTFSKTYGGITGSNGDSLNFVGYGLATKIQFSAPFSCARIMVTSCAITSETEATVGKVVIVTGQ